MTKISIIVPVAVASILGGYSQLSYPEPEKSLSDLLHMPIEQLGQLPVYTASRKLEPLREAPATIIVINAKEIEQRGYEYLEDANKRFTGY